MNDDEGLRFGRSGRYRFPMEDEPETYTTKDARVVELDWSDDEMKVWTTGEERELIGSFSFTHVEGPSGRGDDDYWHLTHMHLEGPASDPHSYERQGIGREIIAQVGADIPIVFTPDDGIRRDDGSHLTGDGPAFARRMVAEGLASWDSHEDVSDDFDDH